MKPNNQFPSILQLFQTLTTFTPRTFQHQTITRILNRQDTILRAPTGSGKTETAIAPFLFAKTLNLDFPNKLVFSVLNNRVIEPEDFTESLGAYRLSDDGRKKFLQVSKTKIPVRGLKQSTVCKS
jgi:N12 class adenine-specific DNA methylase